METDFQLLVILTLLCDPLNSSSVLDFASSVLQCLLPDLGRCTCCKLIRRPEVEINVDLHIKVDDLHRKPVCLIERCH